MKRLAVIFLAVVSLLLSSCAADESYYGHCELVLPLEGDYKKAEADGFDAVFTNGVYTVGIIRISFEAGFNQGIPETMSQSELAYFWQKKTDRTADVCTDKATPYYAYSEDGHFYANGFYRTPYAYFVVLMTAPEEMYPDCLGDFTEIFDGASFEY